MPEGDTIFRAARTLDRALAGQVVTRFETGYAHLARVDDDAPIAGRTVERVEARGKHLLMTFSGDLVLRTHMRMSGSWHIYRPNERWQRPRQAARIVIETAPFVAVGFDVPVAEWIRGSQLARHPELARLGPDPLTDAYDPAAVVALLRARADRAIAEAVLDQRVMAGVGNVYKSEILFLCGVHPLAQVSAVSDDELRAIAETAPRLLRANVGATAPGGIVTYTGLRRTTGRADPGERVWVYGRAGQPCRRCGTPIERIAIGDGARATYFCPRCQPRKSAGV